MLPLVAPQNDIKGLMDLFKEFRIGSYNSAASISVAGRCTAGPEGRRVPGGNVATKCGTAPSGACVVDMLHTRAPDIPENEKCGKAGGRAACCPRSLQVRRPPGEENQPLSCCHARLRHHQPADACVFCGFCQT